MLNAERHDPRSNSVVIRSLTDDPNTNGLLLGCPACQHFETCGGLHVTDTIVDCLGLCCGEPSDCSRVCRNNPIKFVHQIREVDGFKLRNVERAPACPVSLDHEIVPLVYHGARRLNALQNEVISLRLPDLVNYKAGELRFKTREALCHAFRINPVAHILLSGVDHDHRIEPWWTLGDARPSLIRAMKELGVKLVTAPNFSIVLDHPRTDNLHAMVRIAIIFAEFQNEGLACALHPNGRTEKDFERWARFIRERPEVGVLAYEFITGPGRKSRKQFHLSRLADLASAAGRDLDIVVRGDPRVIPFLRSHFRNVIYIETSAFIKTHKRQRAERVANDRLYWTPTPTAFGENIDELLKHNFEEQKALLRALYFGEADRRPKAA